MDKDKRIKELEKEIKKLKNIINKLKNQLKSQKSGDPIREEMKRQKDMVKDLW